ANSSEKCSRSAIPNLLWLVRESCLHMACLRSSFCQRDQLKDQENKLVALQKELELLLEKSGKNSTSRSFQKQLVEKETYLQHEVCKQIFVDSSFTHNPVHLG